YCLRRAGAQVLLVDAYGPGNSRASSGGESRIMRLGYGPDEIYTRSAQRSLALWQQLFAEIGPQTVPLFHNTGVLWLARERDPYCEAVLTTVQRAGARVERLDRDEIGRRFPQIDPGAATWGILENDAGMLMARRAVQAVVAQARAIGVDYLQQAVLPPPNTQIKADVLVFACGPWLPKVFPALLRELIHVTRQEVFFFGVPAGDERFGPPALPVWIDFNDLVYGIPDLDGRGLKLAIDAHGPEFDPDTGSRVVSEQGLNDARAYLARRLPLLADAPVVETRVCQYENTSNGDFLIDRHPAFKKVWIVGGGSGHGFKHGPVVGEYVAAMIGGTGTPEPRFTLATKQRVQSRQVY
ncbi:MAG TPA: FAD-dependent oxidoreductase, partial [Pyrinomonadaceae bacterium]|nr:FAD-dependent oxidoreductase [Pyrinomonadaceae bacterium]